MLDEWLPGQPHLRRNPSHQGMFCWSRVLKGMMFLRILISPLVYGQSKSLAGGSSFAFLLGKTHLLPLPFKLCGLQGLPDFGHLDLHTPLDRDNL